MKKCPNSHENPDNANYCRICGYEFNSQELHRLETNENATRPSKQADSKYTPDLFPGIHFIPGSVFKLRTYWCFWMALTFMAIICLIIIKIGERDDLFHLDDEIHIVVVPCIFILGFVSALKTIVRSSKSARFTASAEFVEKCPMKDVNGIFYRIAKNGKLGLFDANAKKMNVLLFPEYDFIERFDSNHFLLRASDKLGVYSISMKKIIIPVKYDKISQFKDYIAEAIWTGGTDHYDIYGELKN